jgi:hypothetical protein
MHHSISKIFNIFILEIPPDVDDDASRQQSPSLASTDDTVPTIHAHNVNDSSSFYAEKYSPEYPGVS